MDSGRPPKNTAHCQENIQPGVIWDGNPAGGKIGDIAEHAEPHYTAGQTVRVKFWAGHPKNRFTQLSTFLEVQKKVTRDGSWKTVTTDNDPNTKFKWKRVDLVAATSQATIHWTIGSGTRPGNYRIVHQGFAKSELGHYEQYRAVSNVFVVQ